MRCPQTIVLAGHTYCCSRQLHEGRHDAGVVAFVEPRGEERGRWIQKVKNGTHYFIVDTVQW